VKITKRTLTTQEEWKNWQWRSIRDEMVNGAYFIESGPVLTNRPFAKNDMVSSKPGSYVVRLSRYAGALKCVKGKPC